MKALMRGMGFKETLLFLLLIDVNFQLSFSTVSKRTCEDDGMELLAPEDNAILFLRRNPRAVGTNMKSNASESVGKLKSPLGNTAPSNSGISIEQGRGYADNKNDSTATPKESEKEIAAEKSGTTAAAKSGVSKPGEAGAIAAAESELKLPGNEISNITTKKSDVKDTSLKVAPTIMDTTLKASHTVKDTTLKASPIVKDTTLKAVPTVKDTTLKAAPTKKDTTLKASPTVKDTTLKASPALKDTTLKEVPTVKDTTLKAEPTSSITKKSRTTSLNKRSDKTTKTVKHTNKPTTKKSTVKNQTSVTASNTNSKTEIGKLSTNKATKKTDEQITKAVKTTVKPPTTRAQDIVDKDIPRVSPATTDKGARVKIICYPKCENGGTCTENGICECPAGFEGRSCKINSCDTWPLQIPTIKFQIENTDTKSATVDCGDGYIPAQNGSIIVKCVNGSWTPSATDILTSDFRCDPKCDEPILNNGTCVGPNDVKCQFPYGGPSCAKRVDKECGILEVEFENASISKIESNKKNETQTIMLKCNTGYSFDVNGTSEMNLICLEGKWSWEKEGNPLKEATDNIVHCEPYCIPPCKNKGKCVVGNNCTCGANYIGKTCEEKICFEPLPKKENMQFKEDKTGITTVTCAEGFVLSNGLPSTILKCEESGWVFDQFEVGIEVSCIKLSECTGTPENVPNAVLSPLSTGLHEASCATRYTFLTGKKVAYMACLDGKWKLAGNASLNGGCIPSCNPPCLNGGYCQSIDECMCPPNTTGPQCETKKCGVLPVTGNFTSKRVNSMTEKVTCEDSDTFLNGEKSLILTCIDGKYTFPDPYPLTTVLLECYSACNQKCQNGGICTASGSCNCSEEFYGEFCELSSKCDDEAPKFDRAVKKQLTHFHYSVICQPGFTFPGTLSSCMLRCIQAKWLLDGFSSDNLPAGCVPACDGDCSGNGNCVSPGVCSCKIGYKGKKCETRLDFGCLDAPPKVINSIMEYNSTHGYYSCVEGYAMEDGSGSKNLTCKRGIWNIMNCECNDNPPQCYPICNPPCANGGECILPNICSCPKGYSGSKCITTKEKYPCEDSMPPVANSVIEISRDGSYAMCEDGYQFPTGSKREQIVCNKGVWGFSGTKFTACYPICSFPCLNKGQCIGPNMCQCVEPFSGPQCEILRKNLCWTSPPRLEFTAVRFTPMNATLKCFPGYVFKWGPANLNLTCSNGEWTLPQQASIPPCIPFCDPKCLNGGKCVEPYTCKCYKDFTGDGCRVKIVSLCNRPPRAVLYSTIKFKGNTARLICNDGYRLHTGYSEVDIICLNTKWVSAVNKSKMVTDLKCIPICERPCKNGGACMAPNVCNCTGVYTGKWCDMKKCTGLLQVAVNAKKENSEDGMSGAWTCKPGYSFRWGPTQLKFICEDGKWKFLDNISGLDLKCYANCDVPCMNGGRCVAPDICRCAEGFFGPQCQKRYGKTVMGVPCKFPYRYRDEWYYACTSAGYHRPWCATGTNAQNLITSWAVCVADLGMKKVIVTYGGDACIFPFNHRGQEYTGCTRQDRGRPWCATKVNTYNQVDAWGYCNYDWGSQIIILTVRGEQCELPFMYQGKRYAECVEDLKRPWCVTATSNGVATKHGYCMTDWGKYHVTMTINGNVCQFPFIYEGKSWDSCLAEKNSTSKRCAVQVNEAGNAIQLEECIDYFNETDSSSIPSLSKLFPRLGRHISAIVTVRGKRCVIPFWYNDKQYSECTLVDAERPWCATQIDENGVMTQKDFCPPNWDIPEVNMYAYKSLTPLENFKKAKKLAKIITITGRDCSVPYIYKKDYQYGCIEDGFQRPWCATEVDDSKNVLKSEHCPDSWKSDLCSPKQQGFEDQLSRPSRSNYLINDNIEKCSFPFVYKGTTYNGCSNEDSERSWCATSVDGGLNPITWQYCELIQSEQDYLQPRISRNYDEEDPYTQRICEGFRYSRDILAANNFPRFPRNASFARKDEQNANIPGSDNQNTSFFENREETNKHRLRKRRRYITRQQRRHRRRLNSQTNRNKW